MNAHYHAYLKTIGQRIMRALTISGTITRNDSRAQRASALYRAMGAQQLHGEARAFVGAYVMALWGYGGGI